MTQFKHLSDYLRVLYKRRWVAVSAFLLVFVYAATSTLRKTPIYESTTQVLIEKESQRTPVINSMMPATDGWFDDDFYQTQYRMMQSRAIAWRTLTSMGLNQPPTEAERRALADEDARLGQGGWLERFASKLGAPKLIPPPSANETGWQSSRIDGFLAGLSIVPVRNSRLVDVHYRSPDPVFAAKAADALADAYIAQGLSFRALASQDANSFLSTQLSEQKQKLADSEQALQAFKVQHGAVAITDPQNNITVRKLAEISAELTRARSERLEKEQLFQTLNSLRQEPAKLASFPAVLASPTIQGLNKDIVDLKGQDAVLDAGGFGVAYQKRRDIAQTLATKQAELQTQLDKIVESIGNEFQMAKGREDALDGQLKAQKNEALAQDNVAIGYMALERDVVSNRQLYDDLMQRAKVTGVTGEYKGTNVQVIDAAEIPRVPILPNHPRDLLFGLLSGFLLAIGLAFGLEYIDSRIKSPDDIKAHLALPFLGLVPAVATKQIKGPSPLLDRGVPASFSESLRGLRTAVIFSSATEGSRSIMVTSTAPSEGKTVIASNLGDALAQAEQRTIIVDGDMRRPRVHETFEIAQEPGLSNVLAGNIALTAAIRKTNNPYLHVLPAGLIPPNPAELLGSKKYLKLLESLSTAYDWIVIDAPPVMAVTDAAVIATGADGVVFVVGSEMTPRRNAQIAVEQLMGVRAKIVGAVLNRVHVEKHSYYYAQYYRKDYTQAYVRTR